MTYYEVLRTVGTDLGWIEGYLNNLKETRPWAHVHLEGSINRCATGQCVNPIEFVEDYWQDPSRYPFRRLFYNRIYNRVEWQFYSTTNKQWLSTAFLVFDFFDEMNTKENIISIWHWIDDAELTLKRHRR